MKVSLIKQEFNGTRGYKFNQFSYCCEQVKNNPCINLDYVDGSEFPVFSLCHSEQYTEYGEEFTNTRLYRIDYCPFCGEAIEVSVVREEYVSEYYDAIETQRKELWDRYNETDSKKEAQELRDKIRELDKRIDWLYQLEEYKDVNGEQYKE